MLFNRARALNYMRDAGLDAMIATSPVNVTYFTDYYLWLDGLFREHMLTPGGSPRLYETYAVFPARGEPALVVTPLMAVNAADLWVRDLYLVGQPWTGGPIASAYLPDRYRRVLDRLMRPDRSTTPTDALISILRDRGLSESRVGLEMEGMAPHTLDAIRRALPRAVFRDCSNLIRLIRMVKSADEVAHLRRAAKISEEAGTDALRLARAGRSIRDLVQHFRVRVAEQGADFEHFAYDVGGMGVATDPDYVLKGDEIIYVDYGCIFQHYFSDTGRTLAFGDLPAELSKSFAALHDCIAVGAREIRPGVKSSSVHAAMWQTLQERDVGTSFPHGHGLGLEIRDYPILVADNGLRITDECIDVPSDLPLETDMVINLEASFYLLGTGSVHNEQSFLVTTTGCEPLVRQDRSRPLEPLSTQ